MFAGPKPTGPNKYSAEQGMKHSRRSLPHRVREGVRVRPLVGKAAADKPSASGDHDTQGRGIRASSFRELSLCDARPPQQRWQAEIPLVATRLIVNLIRRIALLLQLLLDGPQSRPRRRVVDGDDILDRVRVETRPPFHEMQVFVSSLKIRFRREIRDVDDQRVALPTAS